MNSVAGGGSFLSFPALLFAGVPAIAANATNNAAMWVGTLGSARGYREEVAEHKHLLLPVLCVSVAGSLIGACLLLATPQAVFVRLIPWLLLFATIVFAASPLLTRRAIAAPRHAPWQLAVQFFVAIYGGYFGAGMGILMLAVLAFSRLAELQRTERDQERAVGGDQRRRADPVRRRARGGLAFRGSDGDRRIARRIPWREDLSARAAADLARDRRARRNRDDYSIFCANLRVKGDGGRLFSQVEQKGDTKGPRLITMLPARFTMALSNKGAALLLAGGTLLALSACGGGGAVPAGSSAVPGGASQFSSRTSDASPADSTSILKKLKKDVIIGTTVDPGNGDKGPRGVSIARITYGIKKGQLAVCNYSNSAGAAGKGTTIELLDPTAGSQPTTFVQSSKILGCAGNAFTNGNGIFAAGLMSHQLVSFDSTGKLVKAYGSPFKGPFYNTDASNPGLYAAEYMFTSDATSGTIISFSINYYGNPHPLEIAKGFAVNKKSGWGTLGPSGVQYYPKKDTLYIADGCQQHDRVVQ